MQRQHQTQAIDAEEPAGMERGGCGAVERHFESAAEYWKDIYDDDTLPARIYQQRMVTALQWIDDLALPSSSTVLDIGCGAGLATVALAERGYSVNAVDLAPQMLDLTMKLARQRRIAERVRVQLGPATEIPFERNSFDILLALGLLPWVEDIGTVISEMRRVLRPGGYLLISADNFWRCDHFLDPMRNPLLQTIRRTAARLLGGRAGRRTDHAKAYLRRPIEVERCTWEHDFETLRSMTLGYGPFSVFHIPMLSDRLGLSAHQKLQGLAGKGIWPWTKCGQQYLQLSRKRLAQ